MAFLTTAQLQEPGIRKEQAPPFVNPWIYLLSSYQKIILKVSVHRLRKKEKIPREQFLIVGDIRAAPPNILHR